jgi:hypothetical protein
VPIHQAPLNRAAGYGRPEKLSARALCVETRMEEMNHVVARFLDGKMIKGTAKDFFPNRAFFHILPPRATRPEQVECSKLKAVFFVRTLDGNPDRRDHQGFLRAPGETAHGKKIAIRFKDGELLCGYTLTYSHERSGFFVFPADERGNLLRAYVMTKATVEVATGPSADEMVNRILKPRAA